MLCSEVADGVTQNNVCLFREPDAGNPPVRFDEREQETESSQTGLRRARRKPSPIATGRLQPLRLFSTLLIEPHKANEKRTLPGFNIYPCPDFYFGKCHPRTMMAAAAMETAGWMTSKRERG